MNEVVEGDWKIVTSKKKGRRGVYSKNYGSNSFENQIVTSKKQSRTRNHALGEDPRINELKSRLSKHDLYYGRSVVTSSRKSKAEDYDDERGGKDVISAKSEEDDRRRGGETDVLVDESHYLYEFLPGIHKANNRPYCPYEETEIESCDGEDDYVSEDGYEIHYAEITSWDATIKEAAAEVKQLWKKDLEKMKKDGSQLATFWDDDDDEDEEEEKKKKKKNKKKNTVKHNRNIETSMLTTPKPLDFSSITYSVKPRQSTEYKVYIDAYFKRNRKPRFGIIVKDSSNTVRFGFVGESKSRRLPQLQTHLEGMVMGVKLVNDLIKDSPAPEKGKELRTYVYSNSAYVIDFVILSGRFPEKSEHFTEDVKKMLKQMVVDTYKHSLFLTHIDYYDNRAADYLARSATSKVGVIIPKDEFDDELKAIIEENARYEEACRNMK